MTKLIHGRKAHGPSQTPTFYGIRKRRFPASVLQQPKQRKGLYFYLNCGIINFTAVFKALIKRIRICIIFLIVNEKDEKKEMKHKKKPISRRATDKKKKKSKKYNKGSQEKF